MMEWYCDWTLNVVLFYFIGKKCKNLPSSFDSYSTISSLSQSIQDIYSYEKKKLFIQLIQFQRITHETFLNAKPSTCFAQILYISSSRWKLVGCLLTLRIIYNNHWFHISWTISPWSHPFPSPIHVRPIHGYHCPPIHCCRFRHHIVTCFLLVFLDQLLFKYQMNIVGLVTNHAIDM